MQRLNPGCCSVARKSCTYGQASQRPAVAANACLAAFDANDSVRELIDLQRLEELDKIGFLLSREIEFEQCVIVIDHVEKRRCAAVGKIRLMLPHPTQGRVL